jgi:hypothetical protein
MLDIVETRQCLVSTILSPEIIPTSVSMIEDSLADFADYLNLFSEIAKSNAMRFLCDLYLL